MAIKFGLATGCTISRRSVFARKNYFYPDLPKGYQISQYELPVVHTGSVEIELEDGATKAVRITRAHLEEDAGKSLHEDFAGMSGIDLNRAGTPLLEIVSEPDLRSAAEAGTYMRKIHALVRYLEICDGNMQEGSFRCDANVSVRRQGETKLGTRAELKNLNSFRFVEKAIEVEVAAADRAPRDRRQGRAGDSALRPRSRRDSADAQQGRSERLSLLPGSRSLADRDRRRRDRRRARDPARAARREARALRRAVRPVRLRRGRAHGAARARGLLRGSRGSDARRSRSSRRTG